MAGCAAAMRRLKPQSTIIGVEPAGAPTMRRALDEGSPTTLERIDTIADGLAPTRAGDLTFAHAAALLDDVVLIEDDDIRRAAATSSPVASSWSSIPARPPSPCSSRAASRRPPQRLRGPLGRHLDTLLLGEILGSADQPER